MYENHLACAIKAHDQVLRDQRRAVYLPLGTEFSVVLKNTIDSKWQRIAAKLSIGYADVGDGAMFSVDPGETIEVSHSAIDGAHFKFSEEVVVRVDFQRERASRSVRRNASSRPIDPHFMAVPTFPLDPAVFVMEIKLAIAVDDDPTTSMVFTREKVFCPICGKKSRSAAKFCDRCGKSLIEVRRKA